MVMVRVIAIRVGGWGRRRGIVTLVTSLDFMTLVTLLGCVIFVTFLDCVIFVISLGFMTLMRVAALRPALPVFMFVVAAHAPQRRL